jgi:hypothetical protein
MKITVEPEYKRGLLRGRANERGEGKEGTEEG